MCAALQLVLACVALARVLPARCHDATLLETPQPNPQCGEHSPDIDVYIFDGGSNLGYYVTNQNKTLIPYGNSFTVTCEGADAMKKDGMYLQTETWRENTIEWSVRKPDLHESEYVCIDSATACQRSTVTSVTPVFDVISSYVTDWSVYQNKYIKLYDGNPITVLCSGPAAARLVMTMDGQDLPTTIVNANTIKWFVNEPDLQISEYVCTDRDTAIYRSVELKVLPLIIIKSRFSGPGYGGVYYLRFGDFIEVYCSGPRAVKLVNVEEGNKEIITETVNKTIQYAKIIKFDKDIVLGCVDSIFLNYMFVANLILFPRIEVIAPDVHRRDINYYDVKYGDPIEIACSWPDAEPTLSCEDELITLEEKTVNGSTTTWIIKIPEQIYKYISFNCIGKYKVSVVHVRVIRPPEAVGFRCMSHDSQYLNCTWTSLSHRINFTLSYIENGIPRRVCSKSLNRDYSDVVFCVWGSSLSSDVKMVSFQMQSCNELGCSNETYIIDYCSIVKIAPPQVLQVLSTSSRGAEVIWSNAPIMCGGDFFSAYHDVHYRVEYWYSGIQPMEVNSSLVSCDDIYFCSIKINLPCPGQSYRVRVYHKLKKAVGEDFWSDPSSVTFTTHVKANKVDVVNAACVQKPRKTKEVMVYFVQELRQKVQLDEPLRREYIKSLKDKRARIDAYRAQTGG